MTRKKKSGIYKIVNIVNGKYYIGRSNDLVERKCRHFCHLRKGVHHNKHLQRAFDKYGQESFIFEILEYTENIVEKEQEYFIKYNCGKSDSCYNLRDIVDNLQPDDTRFTRIVSKFDMIGNYIKTYKSIKSAANDVHISPSSINAVVKGRKKSAGGFKWQYGENTCYVTILQNKISTKRKIKQISPDGMQIKVYNSVADICHAFGKDMRHVSCVLNQNRKTAYGYKWEFVTNNEEN